MLKKWLKSTENCDEGENYLMFEKSEIKDNLAVEMMCLTLHDLIVWASWDLFVWHLGGKKKPDTLSRLRMFPAHLHVTDIQKRKKKMWCGYVNVIKDMIMGAMVTMMIMNIDYCSSDIDARNDW